MLAWIVLLISGIFLALAHPLKFHEYEISQSWMTLIGATFGLCLYIFYSLREPSPKKRFWKGFFGAVIFYYITIYWIVVALHDFGDLHISISIFACFLLAGYCALFSGVWALIAGSEAIQHRPITLRIIAIASLWTFMEAIRQYLMTGFGWGEIGFAFHFLPWLGRTSALWGVHGLTFLWVVFAAAILQLRFFLPTHSVARESLKPIFAFLLICLCVGLCYSAFRPRPLNSEVVKISVVQPNIAQELKWNPNVSEENLKTLVDMTLEATNQSPSVVIWPETSFPYLIRSPQKKMPVNTSVPLVIGAVVREANSNRNAALLVEKDQIEGQFNKIHLVPFGEFVPLKDILPFGKLVANAGDFLSGSFEQTPLKPTGSSLAMGPLICYEDVFSRESVRHAKRGANLLINLTNDAWYGDTSAQSQHAAMARFQVYQTGLPMVRATNNGLSTFMSPTSRTDIASFQKQVVTEPVVIAKEPSQTFFVWTYPLMEWIWLALFVIAILWKEMPHQKLRRKKIFFR